ncbi:nucleoside diphosphate kinase-like [Daktulosphaira vitifoliae]|uniref:nucleoside diphosphate kinase-like n=1 Tax=Daktulosphaira vitifoliae TaxID=58002 RepID=UPI0021AA68C2|nr:nucleoside diphosphate kinase-like [Daktulosphaira vitifoliae]
MTSLNCSSLSSNVIPERKWSINYIQNKQFQNLSDIESYSTLYSNVSLFDESELNEQCVVIEYTLAIIKPSITKYMYKIENIMSQKGFVIKKKDILHLRKEETSDFYREHTSELYFTNLVEYISSGPIVVYVLMKKNCIDEWKRLIGPTNVKYAKKNFPFTLRAKYGIESGNFPVKNGFHGSSNRHAAQNEILFFFPNSEIDDNNLNIDDTIEFLQEIMMPTISKGLVELYKEDPNDPLRWFGKWLLSTNSMIN